MAFDDYLTSGDMVTDYTYRALISTLSQVFQSPILPQDDESCSLWDNLACIKHPCLAWWLLNWSPEDWICHSLVRPDLLMLEGHERILGFGSFSRIERIPYSAVMFVRKLVIDGSSSVQELAMGILERHTIYRKLLSLVSRLFPASVVESSLTTHRCHHITRHPCWTGYLSIL
jgi:hypothetical protein